MNKNRIEENANKIWFLLCNVNKRWQLTELQRETGLSEKDLFLAIGWLAHDNRIQIEHNFEGSVEYYTLDINLYIG